MNTNKQEKEFNRLLRKSVMTGYMKFYTYEKIKEEYDRLKEETKEKINNKYYFRYFQKQLKECELAYHTYEEGFKIGLSINDIFKKHRELMLYILERQELMNKKHIGETRDNKDVHVGSGGSNANKIRYPSKKRNLRTWRNFYKLFPYLAIKDNFDGKTSDKMK